MKKRIRGSLLLVVSFLIGCSCYAQHLRACLDFAFEPIASKDCSEQGRRKEHSLSYVTDAQRSAEQSLPLVGRSVKFKQALKPANLFCDHMVLQREQLVPIWGRASPAEDITVTFAGQSKSVRANKDGKWMVKLDPLETEKEGREMIKRIKQILAAPDGWTRQEDIFIRRQPNILYNAVMKPLAPYASRGLVWYQGERNTRYLSGMPEVTKENWFHRVAGMKEYGEILSQWMMRYRREWENDQMNFMVVMLPGYGKGTVNKPDIDPEDPAAHSWAWMRESQLKVLDLPNTAVANTIDLGEVKNVHPKDRLPIGQRLALLAAKNTLEHDILAEGPRMDRVEVVGNHITRIRRPKSYRAIMPACVVRKEVSTMLVIAFPLSSGGQKEGLPAEKS